MRPAARPHRDLTLGSRSRVDTFARESSLCVEARSRLSSWPSNLGHAAAENLRLLKLLHDIGPDCAGLDRDEPRDDRDVDIDIFRDSLAVLGDFRAPCF